LGYWRDPLDDQRINRTGLLSALGRDDNSGLPLDRPPSAPAPVAASPLLRILLFCSGILSTALGVLGIFLPLLPTVPLLLLAAACFARSSPRCYTWLLDHPRLGPMVNDYLDGNGIPLRAKVWAILLLWTSISLSMLLLAPILPVKLTFFVVAIGVTVYLLRLPTRNEG
jgi:uncharacterized membrane protein YbaN (DUF454 family)